jgi:hypothetical protein
MKKFTLLTICLLMVYTNISAQIFYNTTGIRDVRLTFPNDDWDRFLDSSKRSGSEARLTGTLMLEGQKFEKVGVRYKGNSSYFGSRKRSVKKLPLNIKLAKGDLIEGKYATLKLSNINRDASFLREALAYEIVRSYMPAPQCNFAKVYVNDKLMGFYNSVESVDELFVKNHPNTEGGHFLVKCDPDFTADNAPSCPKGDRASLMYMGEDSTCYAPLYEMGDNGSWKEFISFIKTLNQEPDKLERILNVDQTLWMLALNNVMINLDSYNGAFSHNYYLLRTTDGRFTPIMWDLNLSFGGFASESANVTPLSIEQMQTYQPLKDIDNAKRPLISQILKNATYKKIYLAHIRTILDDWFYSGKYTTRLNELAQTIDNQVNADKNKHYSYDDYKKNRTMTVGSGDSKICGIEELMTKRIAFLKAHPLLNRTQPSAEKPNYAMAADGKMTIKTKLSNASRAFCCVRNDRHQPYRYLPMFDDGKHNDDAAGDGIFAVVMDAKNIQYYIMAENDEAVGLMPTRAGFEFYDISGIATPDKILGKDEQDRIIYEGVRGGKYYIREDGNKVFLKVDYKVPKPN